MMASSRDPKATALNENEGSVLGLVARRQPVSTYQLMRIFAESPVTSLNERKATIYPVVRRLKARKLLSSHTIDGDARNTELLRCTRQGKIALRQWIMAVPPTSILLEDPIRTRLQSFDELSSAEQRQWLQTIKTMVAEKIVQVEYSSIGLRMPFQALVFSNLTESLNARKAWLDQIDEALRLEREARPSRSGDRD